jgi:protein-S-isoprenylcysteine O-methyltransferase Ste14
MNRGIALNGLKKRLFLFMILAPVITGLLLFLPAGTVRYWQAWVFMGTLFIPAGFVISYFLKRDPGLLKRRLQYREKEEREKSIIKIGQLLFMAGFLAPGLDRRFGWSQMPAWLCLTADAVIFLSYLFIFFVFRQNSYASRIVEVTLGQKVIDTGPYAVIRHPMYAGVIPMYLSIPLALGSYLALAFFVPVVLIVIARIFDEEKLLLRDLPGYPEYSEKVRYRLIPHVW